MNRVSSQLERQPDDLEGNLGFLPASVCSPYAMPAAITGCGTYSLTHRIMPLDHATPTRRQPTLAVAPFDHEEVKP